MVIKFYKHIISGTEKSIGTHTFHLEKTYLPKLTQARPRAKSSNSINFFSLLNRAVKTISQGIKKSKCQKKLLIKFDAVSCDIDNFIFFFKLYKNKIPQTNKKTVFIALQICLEIM